MDINSTTGQIIDEITLLAEADRVSGRIEVDGILVVDSQAEAEIETPGIAWDADGFSPFDEFGCVMIKDVEAHRAVLAAGDEWQKKVAADRAQWHGILFPDRELDDAVLQNVWDNVEIRAMFGMFGGYHTVAFRHMNPQWINKRTGDLKHNLSGSDYDSHDWSQNPNWQGDIIPNHIAVSKGNDANPDYPRWKTHFVPGLAPWIIKKMDRHAASLKDKAWRLKGSIPPSVGPRR